MTNQGKYMYCIIRGERPCKFRVSGMEGKPVYTVNHAGWRAVVSDCPIDDDDFLITREYTMAHQRVMEEVMKSGYDILPVSFGTVAESKEDIKVKVIERKAEELTKGMDYIKGKMEVNLKVLWQNISSVFKEIAETSPTIKRAKLISQKSPLGRFQAAQIGEIVKKELEKRRERLADKILASLRPLTADIRDEDILQDAMILNTTFLVPRSSGRMYDRRILELAQTYGENLNFMNYGPLPPYNFVSIRVSFND